MPDEFELGIQVAVAAKRATDIPLDADEAQLIAALGERQRAAAGVWLASDEHGVVIGHALVAVMAPDNLTWSPVTDPVVAAALRAGRLLELGGLSVDPGSHRRGVARQLQRVRLDFAHTHDYVPVAAAWNSSPGSTRLCSGAGRPVGVHHEHPITLFHLDRGATR